MTVLPPASRNDRPAARQNLSRPEPPAPRAGSARRLVSLQNDWSNGPSEPVQLSGHVRETYTTATYETRNLVSDWVRARVDGAKRIVDLNASRRANVLADFVGLNAGGALRKAMAEQLPDEASSETGLNALLDELAGASFMAGSAWYAWPGGIETFVQLSKISSMLDRPVTGLCLSYVPGSPAIRRDGSGNEDVAHHPVFPSPLVASGIWDEHELQPDTINHWRLRRTDLWHEDGLISVDAWFQDSSSIPGMIDRRMIFHEYSLRAHLEPKTLTLQAIEVEAHVLPYTTCRAAPATVAPLIGLSAHDLRTAVLERLRGPAGCTHLNDMLRSLQCVVGLESRRAAAQNCPD